MKDWRRYWQNSDDNLHRDKTEEWYRFCAEELLQYFPPQKNYALELGCGSGDLYPFFRNTFFRYVGLDYSFPMIKAFTQNWPGVNLIRGDASHLPLKKNSFDFIFSNGVCQYFSPEMLEQHLAEVQRLLKPTGMYLLGNVPDKTQRLGYYLSLVKANLGQVSWPKLLRFFLALVIGKKDDDIGYWYSRRFLGALARQHGFQCRFANSSSYDFMFHAVLNKF